MNYEVKHRWDSELNATVTSYEIPIDPSQMPRRKKKAWKKFIARIQKLKK